MKKQLHTPNQTVTTSTSRKDYRSEVQNLLARSRREFLREFGSLTAAGATLASVGITSAQGAQLDELASPDQYGGVIGKARVDKAYDMRVYAALSQKAQPLPDHPDNGDEARYPNKIGNYSKGLPHNNLGEVNGAAYETLLTALRTANPDDFERINIGGSVKLVNPQAGLGMDLEGPDPMANYQRPAPALASAEAAGEMVELYWQALARDVNFLEYENNPITVAAANELSRLSDFRGPRLARPLPTRGGSAVVEEGDTPNAADLANVVVTPGQTLTAPTRNKVMQARVTPQTLFRGTTIGDVTGPYLSQFLWKDVPFGAQTISGRMRTVYPNVDYLTKYSDWLQTQNGNGVFDYNNDPMPRYIRNGRDLGEWVHIDVLFQAYFNAMLIMLNSGVPFDSNNPYRNSRTQNGFGTFGNPHIAALVCEVATRALKAVWFQKWYVHRRLRPEAYAGRVHNHVTRATSYPLHSDVFSSTALTETFRKQGSYLLPMGFPEGSPTHPAYGAGHATVAGACVTVLKAWFDEEYVITDPVIPSFDGLSLVPYRGSANLTIGGELNKLAANVAVGRNFAGVHWRSDATESLKLGEAVAIGILSDFKGAYNERFAGFNLTKFDGTKVVIG